MAHRAKPKSKSKAKRRHYKRTILDLKNRTRDLDRIQDDIKAAAEGKQADYTQEPDLPGGGAYHCIYCARHFVDARSMELHVKTKDHKKQVKRCNEEQYTQKEADAGAGMSS